MGLGVGTSGFMQEAPAVHQGEKGGLVSPPPPFSPQCGWQESS